MIIQSFVQLLPILILVAGGFFLTRIYHLSQDTLVKVIVDFFMPMLIFHALYTSDIGGHMVFNLAGAATLMVLILLGLAYLYSRITGIEANQFIPSVIFMNSGFLGIPLMKLWGGIAAMNLIVIYDQIQTIYIFTLGILIIAGGFSTKGLKEMIKSPILWAIFLGFSFRFLELPLADPLLATMAFGGNAAPPLAALAVGAALGETKLHFNRHLFAALFLRITGGFLCGLLGSSIFGLTGISRTVVIVASSLPTAVFASVLPLRYGIKADFAATMVVISTLLGAVTIPLTFWLAS
ncbi:MAG: AEC family transporter [Spirochaetes bacterium]|nr:AEC family transporter [Spirochaetota bacterium]MBL7005641.1 AEC family transporter [Spirochaetia bacterium]